MSEILVPVSFGELLDKIAILQIKSERMSDAAKLANVRNELSALERTWMQHPAAGSVPGSPSGAGIAELRAQLKAVNERLWQIEDDYRSRVPSLMIGSVLVIVAVQIWVVPFLADLQAASRRLAAEARARDRERQYS